MNKSCGRKVFLIFSVVFLAPFLNYSYAIENPDEIYPSTWGMLPVQGESHTLWDTSCRGCYQQLMLPLLFLTSPVIEGHKPFKADIELGQKQFGDLSIAGGLDSTVLFVSPERDWGQIDLQNLTKEFFPVSIETIDTDERSFKVMLGDKDRYNTSTNSDHWLRWKCAKIKPGGRDDEAEEISQGI